MCIFLNKMKNLICSRFFVSHLWKITALKILHFKIQRPEKCLNMYVIACKVKSLIIHPMKTNRNI